MELAELYSNVKSEHTTTTFKKALEYFEVVGSEEMIAATEMKMKIYSSITDLV